MASHYLLLQVGQNGANLPTSAALELYAFYKQATCGSSLNWHYSRQRVSFWMW